jgi:hypothetical protein
LKDEFILEVEQLLRDAYKFYKNSTKRKKGLQATTVRQEKSMVDEFVNTLVQQSEEGKEKLEKRPSLRLQCWNATRWLGRSTCLNSLCKSYEFILEHLAEFSTSRSESAKHKAIATDLYNRITSYDTFLFIYFYRDFAATIARTTRLLQGRDIRIRDVGRMIMNLCGSLNVHYPEDSDIPTELLGDGMTDT